MGILEAAAGMFTYFYVMNDYGFKPMTVLFLNDLKGYYPDPNDVYNPDLPNFGNSNYGNSAFHSIVNWGLSYQSTMDTRLFYGSFNRNNWSRCRWSPTDTSIPKFWRISRQSHS